MTKNEVKIGREVYYYPILGGRHKEKAVITSEPFAMCGTLCCKIDIRTSVVDLENLEAV